MKFFIGCAVWAYKGWVGELYPQVMEEWVTQIQEWLQAGVRIYFFVHCPIEERSPSTARYFQQLLEQNDVAVPPLPWNHLQHPPNQLSLW